MMGRCKGEQGQLFYAFDLEAVVPDDHQVRRIAAVLDLSWVRVEPEGLCADERQVLGEPRSRAQRLEGICGRLVCPASKGHARGA